MSCTSQIDKGVLTCIGLLLANGGIKIPTWQTLDVSGANVLVQTQPITDSSVYLATTAFVNKMTNFSLSNICYTSSILAQTVMRVLYYSTTVMTISTTDPLSTRSISRKRKYNHNKWKYNYSFSYF